MKTKRVIELIHEFHCCEKVFSTPEFKAHLIAEHGYVVGTKGNRSLQLALDGGDFYSNTFEWKIPCGDKIIKAIEVSSGPRKR